MMKDGVKSGAVCVRHWAYALGKVCVKPDDANDQNKTENFFVAVLRRCC
jgi:hypothetical protein